VRVPADRHNQRKKKKLSSERVEMAGTRGGGVAPYDEEAQHENDDLEKGLLPVSTHAKGLLPVSTHAKGKEVQETSHTHGA
jgi:hypothetical protein